MTNESTENKNTAEASTEALTPEEIMAQEIIDQAEEQVEVQHIHAHEVISAEQEKINELELSLSSAQTTIADQKDSVVRAKAEVDNIRRRSAQDVDKARKFALEKFAAEMLVSVDNLERALQNIDKEDENNTGIIEGLELTLQGLIASLEKFGVKGVDPQDQPFNPELHQAMSMQEVPGVAPNTVVAVMQKGYELNGRLIRPAMVMVSKSAPVVDTTA
ncbi:nucleotide exchange factor GrpE [Colwellia sp. PAMC 20917]|uniref:nucleotide exchange factor GrpE n=1 Tax=Colwellia sp. PAMC 20917 TaxID=1816218 RepID=UPI0008789CC5|nr:nucleotide exchange factor GrpE [Colwellia sp. PAMC 20917]AOW76220.1 nucleotide exchange factor GrpE [Colwellia sp. PAMC 20917]